MLMMVGTAVSAARRVALGQTVRYCSNSAVKSDGSMLLSPKGLPITPTKPSTGPRPLAAVGLRGRYFTKTHEWFQVEDAYVGTVGITQVAQRALGEIVFCRLPREGQRFQVMDTIATLEALKSVGEVKCPVAGEVIEVNPRLQKEPALITQAPLSDGWLVRIAFSGYIPRYLQRTGAVARSEVEHLVADIPGLTEFLRLRLIGDAGAPDENLLHELSFDGLRTIERLYVHKAAEELGLFTLSHGSGAGRQLVVRRTAFPEDLEEEDGIEDGDENDEGNEPRQRSRFQGRGAGGGRGRAGSMMSKRR
eukprot:TRINITY_DN23503_c0_g1_i1.p1 TRINITY_DN23503_c0_g1~~TRINITY_DN23503_c0_g1_i1.p1  ORF type:complete len:318 (-),score=52.36 TRINITY_DN23503_c0_g1_i1:126-1043(-)